jgi:hypothetical protein
MFGGRSRRLEHKKAQHVRRSCLAKLMEDWRLSLAEDEKQDFWRGVMELLANGVMIPNTGKVCFLAHVLASSYLRILLLKHC